MIVEKQNAKRQTPSQQPKNKILFAVNKFLASNIAYVFANTPICLTCCKRTCFARFLINLFGSLDSQLIYENLPNDRL